MYSKLLIYYNVIKVVIGKKKKRKHSILDFISQLCSFIESKINFRILQL